MKLRLLLLVSVLGLGVSQAHAASTILPNGDTAEEVATMCDIIDTVAPYSHWIPCAPGTGGSGSATYGQNGTSAEGTANPFADDIVQVGGVAISLGLKAATSSIPTVDANFALTYAAGQTTAPTGEQIIGGEYLASNPTLTTGQVAQLQMTSTGFLKIYDSPLDNSGIAQTGGVGTYAIQIAGVYNTTPPTRTTGQGGAIQTDINGRTLAVASPTANVAQGLSNCITTSGSSLVCKAAAGNLYGAYVANSTAAGFLMVFNSATVPADGTVTPAECVPVASASYVSVNYEPMPEAFSTGISIAFSSTGCGTKTTSGTAYIHGTYQ